MDWRLLRFGCVVVDRYFQWWESWGRWRTALWSSFRFSIFCYCTERLRHLLKFLVAYIRQLEASFNCYDSIGSWHLKYEVCIVRYCHEARKCGSFEDRVILGWPIHNFKLQLFSPIFQTVAETNVEHDSTQWVVCASRDDSMERAIYRLEKFEWDMHRM
jgi:hypothetical protein